MASNLQADRELYVEFISSKDLEAMNDLFLSVDGALHISRAMFYENFIVRLCFLKTSTEKTKIDSYRSQLEIQHTSFSSYANFSDAKLYDGSALVHPVLYAASLKLLGV